MIEQLPDPEHLARARSIVSDEREFEGMLVENRALGEHSIYGFWFNSCDSIDPKNNADGPYDDPKRQQVYDLQQSERLVLLDYYLGNLLPFHYALDSLCHPGQGQPLVKFPAPWSYRYDCLPSFRYHVRFRGYLVDARHVEAGKAGIVVTEVLEVGPEDEVDCR